MPGTMDFKIEDLSAEDQQLIADVKQRIIQELPLHGPRTRVGRRKAKILSSNPKDFARVLGIQSTQGDVINEDGHTYIPISTLDTVTNLCKPMNVTPRQVLLQHGGSIVPRSTIFPSQVAPPQPAIRLETLKITQSSLPRGPDNMIIPEVAPPQTIVGPETQYMEIPHSPLHDGADSIIIPEVSPQTVVALEAQYIKIPHSSLPRGMDGTAISLPSQVAPPQTAIDWKIHLQKGWDSINWYDLIVQGGLISLGTGIVVGFVDEMLAHFLAEHPNALKWIRRVILGLSLAIGLAMLVFTLLGGVHIVPVLIGLAVAAFAGYIGGILGRLLARLVLLAANKIKTWWSGVENTPPDIIDMIDNQPEPVVPEPPHVCGTLDNDYLRIGCCSICFDRPAVYGFVHRDNNYAHTAYCEECVRDPKYKKTNRCACNAEITSTFLLADIEPCPNNNCIVMRKCVPCESAEEMNGTPAHTACAWRLSRAQETISTGALAELEIRYCAEHKPESNNVWRYGLFRVMEENQ